MKTFGEQLREARKERGLTKVQLARRANIGESTVTRMEADKHDPSLTTLRKVMREFPHDVFTIAEAGYELTLSSRKARKL
jgi:transcriptional regulator with XRE-family HTH domain